MKLAEIVTLKEMGVFGKTIKILDKPDGDAEVAGKTGTVVNISPDHLMYYIEFDEGKKIWVKSKNIEGSKR